MSRSCHIEATAVLDLHRYVGDAEALTTYGQYCSQRFVRVGAITHMGVQRHDELPRRQRPDMHMMHVIDILYAIDQFALEP